MDEFELIQKYFVRPGDAAGVITGIGDDGAVLQPDPGRDLVTVVDTIVEGVHFPKHSDAFDVGYRSVAINLSDIAAMGAQPRWMMLALTLPEADGGWLQQFADGLHQAADEWGVQLVGGDTTRGDGIVVSIQLIGDVAAGQAIHRKGAQLGDTIFVSGTIGDAAAGLEHIAAGRRDSFLALRFRRPTARVEIGLALVGIANAAIDLSDGFVADLRKLLDASDVGAEIDLERLPFSDAMQANFDRDTALRFAMTGGDDYELCFTIGEESMSQASLWGVSAIGTITDTGDLVCRDGGDIVPIDDTGYRHFQ